MRREQEATAAGPVARAAAVPLAAAVAPWACASDTATGLCLLNISVRAWEGEIDAGVANSRISPRLTACCTSR